MLFSKRPLEVSIAKKVNFIVATRETTVNHEEDGALQQDLRNYSKSLVLLIDFQEVPRK